MKQLNFLVSGLCLVLSCMDSSLAQALLPPPRGWNRHPSEYYIWKYQAQHVKLMEEKYGYKSFLVSSMWGEKIDWLRMYYEGQEANDIAKVRQMIVESTDWYLQVLNESKEIKELIEHPIFTVDKLQLRWTYRQLDNDQLFIRGDYVAMATLRDGTITYEIFNEEKHDLEVVLQETYAEAKQIVGN